MSLSATESGGIFEVSKTWGHERGISCCFRQYAATSHCNQLHGYALAFTVAFTSVSLDARNWVIDFGGLKELEKWIRDQFDHRTVVAADDPEIELFRKLHERRVCNILVVPRVSCESFAYMFYDRADRWLRNLRGNGEEHAGQVQIAWTRVAEHPGNHAVYHPGMIARLAEAT